MFRPTVSWNKSWLDSHRLRASMPVAMATELTSESILSVEIVIPPLQNDLFDCRLTEQDSRTFSVTLVFQLSKIITVADISWCKVARNVCQ
jgi:hypothetical protein